MRQAVASVEIPLNSVVIPVTASVGVACLAEGESAFDQLLVRADTALYQAKALGRNRVVLAP